MSIKVIVKIRHNEYEYLLFKKNSLKHSMNKTQRKNNTIGNYEIKKKNLSCFGGKISILDNGTDALALGYYSWFLLVEYEKESYFNN